MTTFEISVYKPRPGQPGVHVAAIGVGCKETYRCPMTRQADGSFVGEVFEAIPAEVGYTFARRRVHVDAATVQKVVASAPADVSGPDWPAGWYRERVRT